MPPASKVSGVGCSVGSIWLIQRSILASTPPPPPGPKKKTAKSPGPPAPGMEAWERRMPEDGVWLCQLFGRSNSIESDDSPPTGWLSATVPPREEMGPTGAEE